MRRIPAASRALTAVRAHERARTIPKLHNANTVAWGLLKWDRWCMMVVRHWSKPAWQNMAPSSRLWVVEYLTVCRKEGSHIT